MHPAEKKGSRDQWVMKFGGDRPRPKKRVLVKPLFDWGLTHQCQNMKVVYQVILEWLQNAIGISCMYALFKVLGGPVREH